MKTSRILAVVWMGLVMCTTSGLLAQQPPQQGPPQGPPAGGGAGQPPQRQPIPGVGNGITNGPAMVALVDFERLMTNYVRSKYIRDQIRKDKEGAETAIRKESAEVEKQKEKLKELRPNSREFRELEEQLASRVAELNVRIKIQQRDFQSARVGSSMRCTSRSPRKCGASPTPRGSSSSCRIRASRSIRTCPRPCSVS